MRAIMFIESSVREHLLPEVVDKSKKIERPVGLKNLGHRYSLSSCFISIQPCAIFKSDVALYVVYEETESLA